MKCEKCGSELHIFDGCMVGCDNEKCDYIKHFTEYASTIEAQKEKAESELKAIKEKTDKYLETILDAWYQFAYQKDFILKSYDTPNGKCEYKETVSWHDGGLSSLEMIGYDLVEAKLLSYDEGTYKRTEKQIGGVK